MTLSYWLLAVLILGASLIGATIVLPSAAGAQQSECFTETGFCIAAADFQQYFHLRGGVSTFGFPISREFTLLGFRVQFFQGHILQRLADGRITTMNLLGPGLMPATHINGATFPISDPAIVAATPLVDDPAYSTEIVTFTQEHVLNEFAGKPVHFLDKFLGTVDLSTAFPAGDGDAALLPLLNLEIWGAVTSAPQADPANANHIYQRFQRGIMHYRAECDCTERILLADWFKSVITGQIAVAASGSTALPSLAEPPTFAPLPADLASDMAGSPFYFQWRPDAPRGLARPDDLPTTDLTGAFDPNLPGYASPPAAPALGQTGGAPAGSATAVQPGEQPGEPGTGGGGATGGGGGGTTGGGGGTSSGGTGGGGTSTVTPTPTPTTSATATTPGTTTTPATTTPSTDTPTLTPTPTPTPTAGVTNTPPVVTTTSGALAYTEKAPATPIDPGVSVSDVDSPNLVGGSVAITSGFASGQDVLAFTNQAGITGSFDGASGVLTLSGTASVADYQTALRSVTYVNTSDNPSTATRTVTFTVDDGSPSNNTGSAPRQITVTAVNDPPVNTAPAGPLAAVTDTDLAITGLSTADVDANNGALQVSLGVLHGTVTLNTTVSGGLSSGDVSGNATATVVATGTLTQINATLAAANGVIYHSGSSFAGTDTFTFTTNDQGNTGTGGAQSDTSTFNIVVDMPPSVTATTPANGATAVSPTATISVTFSESVDASSSSFSIQCPSGTNVGYSLSSGPSTTFTLTPTGNLPGGVVCTVTVIGSQVQDIDASPPNAMSSDFVFSFGVAPAAVNDTYAATGNIAISVASSGVLANDQGPGAAVSEVQGSASNVGVPASTSAVGRGGIHGSVTLSSDGSFSYDPPPGFTGASDNFTYRVSNSGGTSNLATVTVNVSDILWFVCNGCTSNNRGTLLDPFTSVGAFSAANTGVAPAPQPGQKIYIRSGTYAGAADTLILRNNQQLDGQGTAASSVITPAANSNSAFAALTAGARPVLSPTSGDAIDVASTNTVRFLDIGKTAAGSAFISGSSFGTLTMNNLSLGTDATPTGRPLVLSNGTLAATVDAVASTSSSGGAAISLTTVAGNLTANGTSTVSGATGGATLAVSGGTLGMTYTGNLSQANNQPLVSISGGHSAGALLFQGTLTATSGTGLQFDNADGTYTYTGPTTLNGGNAAIGVANGSNGSISVGSNSSITNPTSEAVKISGSAPTFTYAGSITKTNGGTAITLSSNTGGTLTFSGGTKTLTTGSSTAVNLTSNTGATINFAGGGLQITTTSGIGFNATGGGTIGVATGANANTITADTGTALNVVNTTIGSGGLTFRSISAGNSSTGPANGIVLSTTGSSGSLTVSGDGSSARNGTGGTLQHTSGDAVALNSTSNVSLSRMNINNATGNGIFGTGVNGFVLDWSSLSTNGTAAQKGAIRFGDETNDALNGLVGSIPAGANPTRISNSVLSASFERNVSIFNTGGTLAELDVTSSTVQNAASGSGFLIETRLNATASAIVTGSTFASNFSAGIQGSALAQSNLTLKVLGATAANTFTSNNDGVLCSNGSGSSASATCEVSNNTFTGHPGNSIFIGNGVGLTSSSAVLNGKIQNNTITQPTGGNNNTIESFLSGAGAVSRLLISGNTVNNNGQFDGVNVNTPDSGTSPNFSVTVTNNHVTTAASGVNGINLNARQSSSACFNVLQNTTAAPSGIGIQVREVSPATASLERGASASSDAATVLAANNPAAGGSTPTFVAGTVTVVNNGTCATPP